MADEELEQKSLRKQEIIAQLASRLIAGCTGIWQNDVDTYKRKEGKKINKFAAEMAAEIYDEAGKV